MLEKNGAGIPATKNTAPDNNWASFPEPIIPLTSVLNRTIETEVHNTMCYKDDTEARISINGMVPERDFVIWKSVRDFIISTIDLINS